MAFTLDHIRSDRKTFDLTYEGETGTITYRPSAVTPEVLDRMAAGASGDSSAAIESMCTVLVEIVEDWDLVGADGAKVPVTLENVKAMPFSFLTRIVAGFTKDSAVSPGE